MVSRKTVSECLCNICKEMRGLPTEPTIPGYQLVHVSTNLSEYSHNILSDNFDEEEKAPDRDDYGDSPSDDSDNSLDDDARGPGGTEGQHSSDVGRSAPSREQDHEQDTSKAQ